MTASRKRPVPQVESLERRDNPTDFPVSNYQGLVDAVAAANANTTSGAPVDDTITIKNGFDFSTTRSATGIEIGQADSKIEIIGNALFPTLDGKGVGRLFNVTAGTVTFRDVVLTGGRFEGSNDAPAQGGAVYVGSAATVEVTRVRFQGNAAVGGFPTAAGAYSHTAGAAFGGAIYNAGTLTVTSSVFDGNQAQGFAYSTQFFPPFVGPGQTGSPGYYGGNAEGGAISGKGTIVESVFKNNAALAGAGGIGGFGGQGTSTGQGGNGGLGGDGGGAAGGALAGQFQVYTSLLGTGNSAVGGAGGQGGSGGRGFDGATVGPAGNGGGGGNGGDALGGAVAAAGFAPAAVLGNTTVSGNSATGGTTGAGGIAGGFGGVDGAPGRFPPTAAGGVAVQGQATLQFASTTVANNDGGGVYLAHANRVMTYNSVFADNVGGDFRGSVDNFAATGNVFESAVLIVGFTGAPYDVTTGGNLVADPALGGLAANGLALFDGFRLQTHPIGTGSPAIDFGDATYITAALVGDIANDGRGNAPRLQGASLDAGSFEAGPRGDVQVTKTQSGNTGTFTVTNARGNDLTGVRVTGTATAGSVVTITGPTPSTTTTTAPLDATFDLPVGASATYTFTATAPAGGGTFSVAAAVAAGSVDLDPTNNAQTFALAASTGTQPLTVRVNQASGQADPTRTPSVAFDVDFNFAVAAFGLSALDLTAPAGAVAAISPTTGTSNHYTVTVTGMTVGGLVTLKFKAGQVSSPDNPGVSNDASAGGDEQVLYNPVTGFDLFVIDTPTAYAPIAGTPFGVKIIARTFTGVAANEFTGTANLTFTPGGAPVSVPIANGEGTGRLTLPAGGPYTLIATAGSLSGTKGVTVPAAALDVSPVGSALVGIPLSVIVTATNYGGPITVTLTDAAGVTFTRRASGDGQVNFPAPTAPGTATVVATADTAPEGTKTIALNVAVPLPHFAVTVNGAPTAGQEFSATVRAVNPDGTTATGFIGIVTVTLTDVTGGSRTVISAITGGSGSTAATFKATIPGTTTIAATATGQATAGSVAVAVFPATDPNGLFLRDPRLQSQERNASILAAGRYANSDNQSGDEPVAVSNLIGEASISVLHISPDHVRNYPQPVKTLTATAATSATVADLNGNGPGGGIPDDVALTTTDGRVVVAITTQQRISGSTVKSPDNALLNPGSHDTHPGYNGDSQNADPTALPPPPDTFVNRFSSSSFAVGGAPTGIVAGHFFNTTFTDLAVANPGSSAVNLLRNNGGGQFLKAADVLMTGVNATTLAAGHIFGVDLDDLAVVDATQNAIRLFKNAGSGSGHFDQVGSLFAVSGMPTKVVTADFDGDGNADVAVATNAGKVEVFYGTGTGLFTSAQVYDAVFAGQLDLLAVDVNSDGRPDLVVGSPNDPGVAVLTQAGKGLRAFYGVRKIALPPLIVDAASGLPGVVNRTTVALATRDFDGDGLADIAVLDNLSEVYTLSRRPAPPPPV